MKPLSYFRRSVVAFPLAALAALAMFVISELSYQDATHALDSLGDRGKARSQLNLLAKSLLDAETGQRGYLLTERQTYLAPYHKAITNIGGSLLWLDQYFGKNPDTAPVVSQLVSATDEKMSELSTTIELHDKGAAGAWRDLMLTDFGRERMVHVRTLIDQLLDYENKQVEIGRKGVYQTLMLNRIGVTAMAAISLLALFMYLRQTAALERATLDESRRVATERDRLEAEVTSRTVQLKELAQHLQTIREDERSHLARELHDELGALLTAAKLDVARLKSRLGTASHEASERLLHLNETLNGGIALKRRIIEDLRPSSLSNLGLIAALEILLREFSARSELKVVDALEPVELVPAAQLTVYRLVQEALTNIVKYAKATTVHVTLEPQGEAQVHVAVRDDGVGFDTDVPRIATHGLLGMRYRVEAEGGEMRLKSKPGHGTTIEAILPTAVAVDAGTEPPLEPFHADAA